jgi:hypothetical protein
MIYGAEHLAIFGVVNGYALRFLPSDMQIAIHRVTVKFPN